jgi:hypothetical protein
VKPEPGQHLEKALTRGGRQRPALERPGGGRPFPPLGWLVLFSLAGTDGAFAQGFLAPPPDEFEKPAAAQSSPVFQNGGIPPLISTGPEPTGPVQFGPLDVHPHFLYQFIYGDGVPAAPTNRVKTVIQEISPGVSLIWGSHWTLDYTPTLIMYSSRAFGGSTDESVGLTGKAAYQDWNFKLSQSYNSSDAVLLQTEAQTLQQTFSTGLTVSRQLGNLLSAQLDLSQNIADSSTIGLNQSVTAWSVSPGLNCQFMPQFGIGVNASAGYDLISPGGNQTTEQISGRINFAPGKKLNLAASVGLEASQFSGTQVITPIFSGSLTYRPWEQTAMSLGASRSVSPSLFQNEEIVTTSLSATLRQRFFGRFTLEGSVGYTTSPFIGLEAFSNANVTDFNGIPLTSLSEVTRQDTYRYARASLGFALLKRGNASIFYQESDTSSGLSAIALTSNQVGFQLGYRF